MNILLTSVGRRSYMVDYFKEALQSLGLEGKVVVSNSDPDTGAMHGADKAYVTPLIYDRDYIPALKRICEKEKIQLLLSLFDIDLMVLACHREAFGDLGVRLCVSAPEVISICNDKWNMCRFLESLSLPLPQTYLLPQWQEADFSQGRSYLIKPRWGMGSLDMFEAENPEELLLLAQKAKRNLEKSYLKYEAAQDRQASVLIQERIAGEEYGLDVIQDLQGNYKSTIVRKKLAMRAGETDIAQVVEDKGLAVLGETLGRALGHVGNLDVDVMVRGRQDQREYYVIDMNARFGGGYPFSHMAGADLPRALILWSLGKEVPMEMLRPRRCGVFAKEITIRALDHPPVSVLD